MSDPLVWGVDRSWSNYRGNSNGDLASSERTKCHVDRGDSTAKCSRRILLNSLKGSDAVGFSGGVNAADMPAGRASEIGRAEVCRRCVPVIQPDDSGVRS